jgi:hypothetical protein
MSTAPCARLQPQALALDPGPIGGPDRHLEHALKYLGLVVREEPRIAPIAYEIAHEIGLAMASMRRIASWSAAPRDPFFQHLEPDEIASLLGIGRRP